MEELTLPASIRSVFGKKTKKLRSEGLLPAVLYGGKEKSATPLAVSLGEFKKVFAKSGESALISLKLHGGDTRHVLVHDFARDPVTDAFLHVDFYEVRMDEKLRTKVPLAFTGESAAVKNEGGILVRTLREIEVECLPKDLPHELAVDISKLDKLNTSLRVRDLSVPAGVSVYGDPEEMVVLVAPPRSAEELAELEKEVQPAVAEEIKTEAEEKREAKEEKKAAEAEVKKEETQKTSAQKTPA